MRCVQQSGGWHAVHTGFDMHTPMPLWHLCAHSDSATRVYRSWFYAFHEISQAGGAVQVKPLQTQSHAGEGFGLGWSPHTVGALASGDCRGKMHTWAPREGGSWAVSGAYAGHVGSVEDIEWSPSEGTVLATACVDKVRTHTFVQ